MLLIMLVDILHTKRTGAVEFHPGVNESDLSWAIDKTPTITATTPAMPSIAATDEPFRCGKESMLNRVTAKTWLIQLNIFISSVRRLFAVFVPAERAEYLQ